MIDERNPYTAYERELMLRKSLEQVGVHNYRFVYIPDFIDDATWMNYVQKEANLNSKTKILTGNDFVEELFQQFGYETIRPEDVVSEKLIDICATDLRQMIVEENPKWKEYAAFGTKYYFEKFGGKDRIVKVIPKEIPKYQKNIRNEMEVAYQ